MIPRPPGLRSPAGVELQHALEPLFERLHDLLADPAAAPDPIESALLAAAFAERVQALQEAGVPAAARLLALLPLLLDTDQPDDPIRREGLRELARHIDTGLLREAAGDPPASIWPPLAADAGLARLFERVGQTPPTAAEWWCPPEAAEWLALPPDGSPPQPLDAALLQAFEAAVLDGLHPGHARAASAPQRLQALCAGLAAAAPPSAAGGWRLAAAAMEGDALGLLDPATLPPRLPSRLLSLLRTALRGQAGCVPVPALPSGLALELAWACVRAEDPLGDEAPQLQRLREAAAWAPLSPAFRPPPGRDPRHDWLPASALDLPMPETPGPADQAAGGASPAGQTDAPEPLAGEPPVVAEPDTAPMPWRAVPEPLPMPAPTAWAEVDLGFDEALEPDPDPEAEAELPRLPTWNPPPAAPPSMQWDELPDLSLDLSDPWPEPAAESESTDHAPAPEGAPEAATSQPAVPPSPATGAGVGAGAPCPAEPSPPGEAIPPEPQTEAGQEPEPPAADPAADPEAWRQIGSLRLPIVRFNQFLHEADESSRRLNVALAEWAHLGEGPLAEEAVVAARQLSAEAAELGLEDLAELAGRVLALVCRPVRPGATPDPAGAALLTEAGEHLRHLLHQFAAGFLRRPPAELMQRLDEALAAPAPASAGTPAAEAAAPVPAAWIDWPAWAAMRPLPDPAGIGRLPPADWPLRALDGALDAVQAEADPLQAARQALAEALAQAAPCLASDLRARLVAAQRELGAALRRQQGAIDALAQGLAAARPLRFDRWAEALRAPVEAAAAALGRPLRFTVDGGAEPVDPLALSRWLPWVEGLLLQAVSEGLESPERRAAAGKPPVATVLLSWSRRAGDEVELMVGDDGAGLPHPRLEALRAQVEAQGLSLRVETLRGEGCRIALRGICGLPAGPWLGLRVAGWGPVGLPAHALGAAQAVAPAAWRAVAAGGALMWQGHRLPALAWPGVAAPVLQALPAETLLMAVQTPGGAGLVALEAPPLPLRPLNQVLPPPLLRRAEAAGLGRDAGGTLWMLAHPAALRLRDQPPPA